MNLKALSASARKLVETIAETDADEKYDLVDAEEDGDTITLTFSKIAGIEEDLEKMNDDDE